MELDLTWMLWGVPLAFVLGWGTSRFDLKQWKRETRQAPKSYFRGLNHLLNEQQDEAIDAFIEAVQHDPDTSELHFALGNLFRRRGDYDRAVRVHEHLLARGDLSSKDRVRAQYALAQDFLKAGLLDRAESALKRLEATDLQYDAHLALLAIYERSRDWLAALDTARHLDISQPGAFRLRQSHYLCELADSAEKNGPPAQVPEFLDRAITLAPEAARPRLAMAHWQQQQSQADKALATLLDLNQHCPQALPLAARDMALLAQTLGCEPTVRETLIEWTQAHGPSLDVTQALAMLSPDNLTKKRLYLDHLSKESSLVVADWWFATHIQSTDTPGDSEDHALQKAIHRAAQPLQRYRCAACGFEAQRHFWHCPGCQSWDSYPARRVDEL